MSREVFEAGIKLAEDRGAGAFLGGGEPTDHPLFNEFLIRVLSSDVEIESSGCITNGSNEKEALLLAKLAPIFYTALSLTQYHDTSLVTERVLNAYKSCEKRLGVQSPFKIGRGKNIFGSQPGCVCYDLHMEPNGDLFHCSCKKLKYGNVLTGYSIPDDAEIGECSEYLKKQKAI
jgi:hypothetical protein